MSEITVGNGWFRIIASAIDGAASFPEEWGFEIVGPFRVDGALKLDAKYFPRDMPVDERVPHPWRELMALREKARTESLVWCEVCGRRGRLRGAAAWGET